MTISDVILMNRIQFPKANEIVPMQIIKEICMACDLWKLWLSIESDPPQKPFSSDGASCFPDQIGGIDIYPAAFLHDLKYWAGDPAHPEERYIADHELAIDLVRLCGAPTSLADLVLAGVRMGGSSRLPTRWRWGFGRV